MNKIINNKIIVSSLGILAFFALGSVVIPITAGAARDGYVSTYGSTPFRDDIPTNNDYNTYQSSTNSAPVTNPKPSIRSISPSSSNVGVGTKSVTITGNGFIPSSVAKINDANRQTTFIDSSHLLITVTGNDTFKYYNNGGFFITVWNGAPGGGYSNTAFFTVKNPNSPAGSTTSVKSENSDNTSGDFIDVIEGSETRTNGNFNSLAANAIFGANSIWPSGLIQWIMFAILILLIVILVRRIHGGDKKYEAIPLKHE